jgi:type IV secretion system protein VirD4
MRKDSPAPRQRTFGLPLGWWTSSRRRPAIGFRPGVAPREEADLLTLTDDRHLLTIAPTGAGKGRSVVIPALLTHAGSTLTIDLKGENYQVTARYRRELGHRVVALDPFRIVVGQPDALNPLDLFQLPGSEPDCESEQLAELATGGQVFSDRDRFWDLTGKGLLTGLIGLAGEAPDAHSRTLGELLDHLYADDVDYQIACALDTHTFTNDVARQELAAYLNHESDRCRPSVRSTAQAMVKCLGSRAVRAALGPSTFDLAAWLRGDPLDIYLIFPPEKLDSHRGLLRLWLGTLLAVLLRRQHLPAQRTLLLLDETAQLGTLPQLRTALTLLRGYGVQVWSLWQDLSQLRLLYPLDWETIVNNSAVIQAFGLSNGWVARGCADILGVGADELLALEPDAQMLLRPGHGPLPCRRVDYLNDALFRGRFDANPRYSTVPSR